MNISSLQFKVATTDNDRLLSYVSVVFDESFAVHNIRVIQASGCMFLAMPSKKNRLPCLQCRSTNAADANYCSQCGHRLTPQPVVFHDVCHPINSQFRERIQKQVLQVFETVSGQAVALLGRT